MATIASLLAGAWTIVVDPSTSYVQPSAGGRGFPSRLSTPRWPVLGQIGFTLFFSSSFARNWQGGMTLTRPSGTLMLIPASSLIYGISAVAGALTPTNEVVAYTTVSGDLSELGSWGVYLTSATAEGGTGQGVAAAGSGTGTFTVLRS